VEASGHDHRKLQSVYSAGKSRIKTQMLYCRAELATYGTREDFLVTRHSLLFQFFSRPSLLYYEEMYIIIYEGVDVAYGHHYYQVMLRVNSFFIQTRSGEELLFA
jgi:hypothetical protein